MYAPVHPQYSYPAPKNIYARRIEEEALPILLDGRSEENRGGWRGVSPLYVEIGCNGGHFLVPYADRHREWDFVGLDLKYKQLYRAAIKAKRAQVGNVRWVRAYAQRLHHVFALGEIDGLFVFFPDPWPKRATWKNRLITESWLRQVHPLLSPDARVIIKTDDVSYAQWIGKEANGLVQEGLFQEVGTEDLELHPTLFEGLAIRAGAKVHCFSFKKLRPTS